MWMLLSFLRGGKKKVKRVTQKAAMSLADDALNSAAAMIPKQERIVQQSLRIEMEAARYFKEG